MILILIWLMYLYMDSLDIQQLIFIHNSTTLGPSVCRFFFFCNSVYQNLIVYEKKKKKKIKSADRNQIMNKWIYNIFFWFFVKSFLIWYLIYLSLVDSWDKEYLIPEEDECIFFPSLRKQSLITKKQNLKKLADAWAK